MKERARVQKQLADLENYIEEGNLVWAQVMDSRKAEMVAMAAELEEEKA